MRPVVFGADGKQLMGSYHAPEPEVALAAGVVLCNPFGYEAMCTHRTYRQLAERLAIAGFHVLRFDYHGTGDSSGRNGEPNRIRAWVESVRAAVDELRRVAGIASIDLFGVRLGATVAVLASLECNVRDLVLWAPAVSGRAFLREVRALQLLKASRGLAPAAPDEQDGHVAGAPFEPTTARELSSLNLLSLRGRFAERALIIPRDDLPNDDEKLALHLRQCGVEAVVRAEPGYARMMDHPEIALVPLATLDIIVAWLRRPKATVERRPAERALAPFLAARSQASLRAVREEALSFGEGNRLFGILTEAETGGSGRTAVVFLNAGANHRVGPNRLYVSLARDLAARGYPAFRVDVGGIGDGARAAGREDNEVYSTASVADVKAAMTFLTSTRGFQRFVLVGICSGGFLAFHTSADDARVAGQIVINPQTFEWKKGDSLELSVRKTYKSTHFYLRELRHLSVWTRALRGKLDLRGVAGALRHRSAVRAAVRLRDLVARWQGLPKPRTEVERVLRGVSRRGIRTLMVFSSNDGGVDMIEQHLGRGASRMQDDANFRLEIVDGADHTFTQEDAQSRLDTMITRFVGVLSSETALEVRPLGTTCAPLQTSERPAGRYS
jgi:pimeloyl-ACP methyl ester carboxylesterase